MLRQPFVPARGGGAGKNSRISPGVPDLSANVNEHFRSIADGWIARYRDRPSFQARFAIVGAVLVREVSRKKSPRILDLGAGPGVFSAVVSGGAQLVFSLDASHAMLSAGHERSGELARLAASLDVKPDFSVIHRVAGRLDCIAETMASSFDVIAAVAVLEYMEDLEYAFARIAELLAPDGIVIVTLPNPRSLFRRCEGPVNGAARALSRVYPTERLLSRAYGAVRPWGNKSPWREAATRAGLVVDNEQPVPLGLTGWQSHLAPSLLLRLRWDPKPDGVHKGAAS